MIGVVAISAKLLNEGERVVVSTRTHVKVLFGALLVLLATAFLVAYVGTRVESSVDHDGVRTALGVLIGASAVAVVVWFVLRPFVRWATTTYTFTDRRFIQRSGLVARSGRTIPLNRISGVDFEIGVVDRLLGCGTLVVSDASEEGRVALEDIPRVEEVQRLVAEELHNVSDRRSSDDGT
jgi:uncharacterized membrane protein YdbT with pleckstrin-like domain